ncbi:MAG: MOSC domain-containing protein [Proteobacteria bacterium]|nr:MOSC domain-containing protein [Pseudomonadota bacterium]
MSTSSEGSRGEIVGLYRYPVKGLSAESLDHVALDVGKTFPHDRAYAIENGAGRFDPDDPKYLPKIHFLMLMRDERLATLSTQFDDTTDTLTVLRDGRQVARGNLTTPIGRKLIEQFFAAYMKGELRGAPKVVSAPDHSFSDVAAKCVHIVNLASLRELERVTGRKLSPIRFRPNVVIDGVPPWEEFNWLGREIDLGSVRLKVFKRTQRCDATNVDPATGAREGSIPAELQRTWGHADFGVYAKVISAGELKIGDGIAAAS